MKSFSQAPRFVLALLCLALIAGCRRDRPTDVDALLQDVLLEASQGRGLSYFQLPADGNYSALPQDPNNPITREKVELGKMLFHETALGMNPRIVNGEGTYSCASCHHSDGGFQAAMRQGIGEGGTGFGIFGEGRRATGGYPLDSVDVQPIRTPSAMNIAYQEVVLWNGQFGATGVNTGTQSSWAYGTPIEDNHLGYEGTETQAIAGLKVHRMKVDQDLINRIPAYDNMFAAAFPGVPAAQRVDREYAGLAIAAYERTLLSNQAPFQKWLRGDQDAMDDQEKNGAVLFFGKANCGSCHTGPALNSMEFHALGMGNLLGNSVLNQDPNHDAHLGRGGFTGNPNDFYKFKVPQLYNLMNSPFYGHGGTFTDIESVVRYKSRAVPQTSSVPSHYLASEFRPLNLTDQEIRDVAAFIERGLYDDNLRRFVPTSIPSGQCFPNNDPTSRVELGCN